MINNTDLDTFFETLISGLGITRLDNLKTESFSPSYTRIMNKIAEDLNEKINDKIQSEEGVLNSNIIHNYVFDLSSKKFSQKTLYVWLNALKSVVMKTNEVKYLSDKSKKVIEIELDDICYSSGLFSMDKVRKSTRKPKPLTRADITSIIENSSGRTALLVDFLIRTACPGRRLVQIMNDDIRTDGDLCHITIPVRKDHTRTAVVPTDLIHDINQKFTGKKLLFADKEKKMTRVHLAHMITEAGIHAEHERDLTIGDIVQTTYTILTDASFTDREAKYYTGIITKSGNIKKSIDRRSEEINQVMNEFIK